MTVRKYTSTAETTTLSSPGVTSSSQSTITLSSVDTFPPLSAGETFTLVINPDTNTEEIVTVTSYGSGNVLNVTRGVDGTTAQSSHAAGSKVRHMITARDLQEPNDHINASSSVHGISGVVVGTTDTQTLTNKTLTSPKINSTTAVTASSAELNYTVGVTSNIQTQLDSKVSSASNNVLSGTNTISGSGGTGNVTISSTSSTRPYVIATLYNWTGAGNPLVHSVVNGTSGNWTSVDIKILNSTGSGTANVDYIIIGL